MHDCRCILINFYFDTIVGTIFTKLHFDKKEKINDFIKNSCKFISEKIIYREMKFALLV